MERHGVSKPPAATANEFARLVEQEWKAAGPLVADVTALCHQGRFSLEPRSPEYEAGSQIISVAPLR